MARNDPVPADDDITRWVKLRFIARDDTGVPIRDAKGKIAQIAPQAFELREDEEYLSVTWLQCFGADRVTHLPAATEAVKNSQTSKSLAKNSAFAIAQVALMAATCLEYGAKVRILQEPEDDNVGHVAVRRFPAEASDLHVALASDLFGERYTYQEILDGNFA